MLRACAAFGVNNICSSLPSAKMDEAWSVDALSKLPRARGVARHLARHGAAADELVGDLAGRDAGDLSRQEPGARPQHRRHLPDDPQLRARRHHAGEIQLHPASACPRTGTAPGRGTARYSEFVYAGAKQDPPLTIAGTVDADTYWERITYFLERVVPVAEEYKVKMGCHPQDPGRAEGHGLARRRRGARRRPTG